tara:strand:+ start:671 stop:985 length:315 start_codon:yes stop_codon:yes gene_type:complete
MNNKKIIYLFLVLILMSGCGGGFQDFKKAVTGEKIQTTDEFLIKKKDPLILPPQYEKLPLPGNEQSDTKSSSSLKSILDTEQKTRDSKNISDLENQVLREIRKK